MKKRTKEVPEFNSLEDEIEFWDKNSAVQYLEEDSAVEIDVSEARQKRDKRLTQQISLRVSHQVLEGTKNRARILGVPYQTLIQLWIAERLEEEEAFVKSLSNQCTKRRFHSSGTIKTK
ncbi:MAG: CopG family antitoxin [Armatimonadota bacterium]